MSATQKNIDEMIADIKLPQNVIDNLNRELKERKVTKKQMEEIVNAFIPDMTMPKLRLVKRLV